MAFRFQLALYNEENRNTMISLQEYLHRRKTGQVAWDPSLEDCKLILESQGKEWLAERNMGSLELLMVQFEAAWKRLRHGQEAIVRSGVLEGQYVPYLLFEPAGAEGIILSSFFLDDPKLDWAFPIEGISYPFHDLYSYVREHREKLFSCLDRFGPGIFFTNVPCPAAELQVALQREARLVRQLYKELETPWEWLTEVTFCLENLSGDCISEIDLATQNDTIGAALLTNPALNGAIILNASEQPEVQVKDSIVPLVRKLCFGAIPDLVSGKPVTILHHERSAPLLNLATEELHERITGDQIPEVRVLRDELIPGLYGCGQRFLAFLRQFKGSDPAYEAMLRELEQQAEIARQALQEAEMIKPGSDEVMFYWP